MNAPVADAMPEWFTDYVSAYAPKEELAPVWVRHRDELVPLLALTQPKSATDLRQVLAYALGFLAWAETVNGVASMRMVFTHTLVERYVTTNPRGWKTSSCEVVVGKLRRLVRAAAGEVQHRKRTTRTAPAPYSAAELAQLRTTAEGEPVLAKALEEAAAGAFERHAADADWRRAKAAAERAGITLNTRRLRVNSAAVLIAATASVPQLLLRTGLSRDDVDNAALGLLDGCTAELTDAERACLR